MIVKVGSKGQVTIPKSIRKRLSVKPGDNLSLAVIPNGIVIRPVSIFDLVGSVPVPPEGPYTVAGLRETAVTHILERNQPLKTEH